MFFPGSSGAAAFWEPVARRLPAGWTSTLCSWPGAGDQPALPGLSGYADLVEFAAQSIGPGSDIVAQSMGGAVAVGLALTHPEKVRRLVLVATSGGLDLNLHATEDWRAEYRATFPNAASWVSAERPDHTARVPSITAPTLLIWGDRDPISPVSVGEQLDGLLPDSHLRVLPGATHSLACDRPDEVAALIIDHLGSRPGTLRRLTREGR